MYICFKREKLKDYWQKLIALDKITDFTKHHCSLELKDFLQVDANTLNKVYHCIVFFNIMLILIVSQTS